MIDTNKYENITPERWTVDEEDPCRVMDAQECTIARTDFVSIDEEREWQLANAQLIADAPLFLAEVERLREVNDDLICELQGFQEAVKEDEAGYKDLVASLEGIEEELKAEVKRLRGLLDEIDDVVYYNDKKAGQVLPVEKPNLELLRDIMMSYTDEAYQIRGDEGEWIE